MEAFLKLPHTFHVALSIILVVASYIHIDGLPEYSLVISIAYISYWMIYSYAVSVALSQRVEKRFYLNMHLFLINWVYTYLSLIIICLMAYAYSQGEFHSTNPLLVLGVFYLMYSIIFSFVFPARIIKLAERDTNVTYGESLGTFLLLIIMPLNTIFVHKRIIAVLNKPIIR